MKNTIHEGHNDNFWKYLVVPTVIRRDNYTCVYCGSKKNLDVSHNKYGDNVSINDLETLCRSCHKKKDNALGLTAKRYTESQQEETK